MHRYIDNNLTMPAGNLTELIEQNRLTRSARTGYAHEPTRGSNTREKRLLKVIKNILTPNKYRRLDSGGWRKRICLPHSNPLKLE